MRDKKKKKTRLPDEPEKLRRRISELEAAESGRRSVEEELRESEELFRAVVESAKDSIFIKDRALKYVRANNAMQELFGMSAEELFGKTDEDLFGPETAKHIAEIDFRVLNGELVEEEVQKPVQGTPHTFHVIKVPIRDSRGDIVGLGGIARDITERKRAEEALKRSEEHFRLLIENALDLVIVLKADGTVIYVGPSIKRLLGYESQEFTGKNIAEFIHPDDARSSVEALKFAAGREGVTQYAEIRVRHKDGSWRMHEVSSYNLLDNPAVEGMVINSRDITDRRLVDEELEKSRRSLSILMGNLPGMAYRCRNDREWTMEFVSEGCYELTGYRPSDLLGSKNVSFGEHLIHPDYRDHVWDEVQAAFRKKEPFQIVYPIRTASGGEKWVWEQGRGVFSPQGELLALEGFITDITDRRRAESLVRVQRDLAFKLGGTSDLDEVLETAFEAILEVSGLDCGGVYIKDEETGCIDLAYHKGLSETFINAVSHYEAGSANAMLIEKGRPIYEQYEKLKTSKDEARLKEGLRVIAIVPIMHEGRVIGCVNASSYVLDEIPASSRDMIEILAGQIGQAMARSRLMSALKDSEERYRLIYDYTGESIYTYDTGLTLIGVNRKACELMGYSEDEIVGRNILELGILHPDDFERTARDIRRLFAGEVVNDELRFVRKDGSVVLGDVTGAPLYNRDGEIIAFTNVARDITERRLAEEALKESEERYRVTFETTGTAMFLVDRDATISDVNREIEKMFGYARDEVVGKMLYMDFIAPEDVERVKGFSVQLLRGEIKGPIQYEIRVVHKTGKRLDALINVNVLPGIDKSVVSVIDITDKKAYERELKKRAEQLRDFLDIAAHELRHPATLLKGYAMTLDKHGEIMDEEAWSKSMRAIETGADRLVEVVEELLDVSRIERGRFPVVKQDVKIGPLVNRAAEEMRARGCDNELQVELVDDIGGALVDPERLVRLLVILLDNAIKYSPPGSSIEIEGRRKGEEIVLSVLNRGSGIPEEDRDRIFDRFYQVEDVLHHTGPGMGLGLYIGKRIAEAHGGSIWYEPREGGGSVFRFTLPS